MEILATLHYINLALIPRDYDVAPPNKNSPVLVPRTKSPRTATDLDA